MVKLIKPLALSICIFLVAYLAVSARSILIVTTNKLSYGGTLFLAPAQLHTCYVTDLAGNVLYSYPIDIFCHDFKRLDNGDWILFDSAAKAWKRYAPYSDTIKATYVISGGTTDPHEIILADDYVWLMGRDEYPIVTGTLVFTIRESTLQKQDLSGNVLFDWHSQDYIGIDEATIAIRPGASFPHSNSFYEGTDGNLIVSFRHINSVVKICITGQGCQAGDIIWRLGGLKSDFVFVNDRGIAKQHSAIMTDICHGGASRCLLLFDNGNDFEPQYSRAVEYVLDVAQGIVTKTWEYTAGGQIFAFATGNVKRLDNGDTVIGWGTAHRDDLNDPTVTVVDWGGGVRYEAALAGDATSYRAHLYPVWRMFLPVVSAE